MFRIIGIKTFFVTLFYNNRIIQEKFGLTKILIIINGGFMKSIIMLMFILLLGIAVMSCSTSEDCIKDKDKFISRNI